MKKVKVHSHADAFFNGSLETGLGSLNGGEMGFDLMTLVTPLIQKATGTLPAPASTIPAPVLAPKVDNTMKYVKYGAIAVGGVVGLMLIMKMLKGKPTLVKAA